MLTSWRGDLSSVALGIEPDSCETELIDISAHWGLNLILSALMANSWALLNAKSSDVKTRKFQSLSIIIKFF